MRHRTYIWTNNAWVVIEEQKFISDPVLFGRHIVELKGTNNTLVRSYVCGLDLSGTMDGAGEVGGLLWVILHTASGAAAGSHFGAFDGNGNVVALFSATTGTETARYEYGPFGEPIRIAGPAATLNRLRFSTKRTCNATELVLYEYRVYHPSIGRWLSRDPIKDVGFNLLHPSKTAGNTDPTSYGFVANNVVYHIDPFGLWYDSISAYFRNCTRLYSYSRDRFCECMCVLDTDCRQPCKKKCLECHELARSMGKGTVDFHGLCLCLCMQANKELKKYGRPVVDCGQVCAWLQPE